jgi:hypothetical protein
MPRGERSCRFAFRVAACAVASAAAACTGCKSDLNQQLLERELRYQEDQIYQLQDELQAACARIERASSENSSLKRQLGMNAGDSAVPRAAPVRPRPGVPAPVNVPPALEIPDAPLRPGGVPPSGPLAPPALEGVPPLPGGPPATPRTSAVPPASGAEADLALPPPAGTGPVRRLSHEELAADAGRVTHLVVNAEHTACLDTDGDGTSDGLTVVFEPRDADERLVAAAGSVSIAVFDAAAGADTATGEAAPIARWDIPAEESLTRFRRTSRQRGLAFQLPWPGRPPAGDHVRVAVRMTPSEGTPLEADATVAVR